MEDSQESMRQAKDTLYALILGTVFFGTVMGAVGTILFVDSRLPFALGTALGMVTACGIAVHLYKTIDKALDMEAEAAVTYTRQMALLRIGLMGIPVIAALLLPEYLHVLGVFLGLLGLKAGAFLQTGILKLIQKNRKEGERKC